MSDLGGRTIDGFAAGSTTVVRVSGVRTVAAFTLPPDLRILNDAVLLALLRDSSQRDASDFASLATFTIATQRPAWAVSPSDLTPDERRLLEDSVGGGGAVQDVLTRAGTHWLIVEARVSKFVPGTYVYLLSSSEPLVITRALVGADGTASVQGALRLDDLDSDLHRIRVAGTRDLGTAVVGSDGTIRLSSDALAQIALFDEGTNALIHVSGTSTEGAVRVAVGAVSLPDATPCWVVLVLLALDGVIFSARTRRMLRGPRRAIAAAAATSATGVAAAWTAWSTHNSELFPWIVVAWSVGVLIALAPWPTRPGGLAGTGAPRAVPI